MKTIALFLLAGVSLICGSISISGQGTGCSSGKRVDGIYYTDCYADTGDDTTRLQTAVYDARGGKLIFNESSYSVSDAIPLYSHSVLEGLSPAGLGVTKSLITMTANNKSIFTIGTNIYAVTIRDLGLKASSTTGTVGITAVGADINAASSHMFRFEGLWFEGLGKGLYVYSSTFNGGWQFDDVHLEDSSFDQCTYAVYINTTNTGWQMNNLVISSGSGQYGIFIERAGYISINMVVGNAARVSGIPVAEDFIHIERHGVISIQNTSGEFYKKQLKIGDGTTEKAWAPIYLINNGFSNCPYSAGGNDQNQTIEIAYSIVVSSGNDYSCADPDSGGGGVILTRGPSRPRVLGTSDIISVGDWFCKWGSIWCGEHVDTAPNPDVTYYDSGFVLEGGVATLNSSNVLTTDDYYKPVQSIYSTLGSKILLELGNSNFYDGVLHKYKYTFARNSSDSWLEIEGNLDPPYAGYRFKKGPVQLAGVTTTTFSNHSSAPAGSTLYCSNCTAGTNPCSTSGGGGGALAVKIENGNWACK